MSMLLVCWINPVCVIFCSCVTHSCKCVSHPYKNGLCRLVQVVPVATYSQTIEIFILAGSHGNSELLVFYPWLLQVCILRIHMLISVNRKAIFGIYLPGGGGFQPSVKYGWFFFFTHHWIYCKSLNCGACLWKSSKSIHVAPILAYVLVSDGYFKEVQGRFQEGLYGFWTH